MSEVKPNVHYDDTGRRAFSVHDVGFSANDGKQLEGYLCYSVNGGPLCSSTFRGHITAIGTLLLELKESHLCDIQGLVEEVSSECVEALAYRRDELKELN